MAKKIFALCLLAAGRATGGHALLYLLGDLFQFVDKGLTVDFIKHVARFFLTVQNPGFVHAV